jgi:hypothetical protein
MKQAIKHLVAVAEILLLIFHQKDMSFDHDLIWLVLFLSTTSVKLRVRALLIILVIGCLTLAKLLIMRGSSTPKRGKSTSDNRKPTPLPVGALSSQ